MSNVPDAIVKIRLRTLVRFARKMREHGMEDESDELLILAAPCPECDGGDPGNPPPPPPPGP